MKTKLLLSTFVGAAVWSLSSLAMANWDPGPCPGGGSAPCIEAEVSGNTYHFNGSGGHGDDWHGLPTTGEDFEFVGNNTKIGCNNLNWDCTLSWSGKVKKCRDSSGDWRIGVQVNQAGMTDGFLCNVMVMGGFPWYSKDPAVASHCPFTDDCDSFIPYDATASAYTANFGSIDIDVLGPKIVNGHVHEVVFTPGAGANFDFRKATFFDCNESDQGCVLDGMLILDNATSLDIQ